jgi:sulfite reductase beta subunit-like hemoprotein
MRRIFTFLIFTLTIYTSIAQKINTRWLDGKTFITQTGELFEFKENGEMTFLTDYGFAAGDHHTYSFKNDTLHVMRTYIRIGGIDRKVTEKYRFKVEYQDKDSLVLRQLDLLHYPISVPGTLYLINIKKKALPLNSFVSYSHEDNHTFYHSGWTDSTGEHTYTSFTITNIRLDKSRKFQLKKTHVIITPQGNDTITSLYPQYEKNIRLTPSQYKTFLQYLSYALAMPPDTGKSDCAHPFKFTLEADRRIGGSTCSLPIVFSRFVWYVIVEYQVKFDSEHYK